MRCVTTLKPAELSTLAKIPSWSCSAIIWATCRGRSTVAGAFDTCNTFVKQVNDAGGDAEMMSLPKLGIKGNSHMLMQDKNNLQLADLILAWIDKHVEKKVPRS